MGTGCGARLARSTCTPAAAPARRPPPCQRSCVPGLGVLRAYRPDGSMNYEQNTLVPGDEDLEAALRRLLHDPDVSHVHVRTVLPQCFLYSVTIRSLIDHSAHQPRPGALI